MNYNALITAISDAHRRAQAGAAGAVNRHLVLRNWLIGAHLVEFEQNGEDRAAYGIGLLRRVSDDLRTRKIPGTSPDLLERMRLFFQTYPQLRDHIAATPSRNLPMDLPAAVSSISATPSRKFGHPAPSPLPVKALVQLSWSHFVEMVRLGDPWKRAFYENECLKGNWSVRQLQRQIGSLLYERTGLSTDKHAVIEHARQQAADAPTDLASLIRDPYVLEFTGLADKNRYLESDLESSLLDHLQAFLLELGTGFCFEARQKRVTVGNEHDYLDLVFYHRLLRCHLLIDLKVRAFRHGDAGQMNFYLNYWKAEVMAEGDNPPVGLLLCADKNQTKVEYATGGLDHQIFVSRYLVALPAPEQIQQLIETDRAVWQQHHPDAQTEESP
jgi:predicted nuclease of restriction endonuclease-like (RecB) superfamily